MNKIKVFVGIDVSKDWLDFSMFVPGLNETYTERCTNLPRSILKVINKIRKRWGLSVEEVLFCMEHTGIYCAQFLQHAAKLGLLVWMESAWKIRRTVASRGKSDVMDAARIAEYAFRYKDKARLWVPEPVVVSRLRDLMALRERLITSKNMLVVPKSETKAMRQTQATMDIARHSDPVIKVLEKQIKAVDDQIDELIAQNPAYQQNLELACSIPAVGRITALSLIIYTGNFTLFDNSRKLACYCGVAPFEHTSGTSIRGKTRVSHFANKALKKAIHMAALSSLRYNEEMKAYFIRKVSQGKNKMSVINAIRNKLLHCIMAIVSRKSPWVMKSSKSEESFAPVA